MILICDFLHLVMSSSDFILTCLVRDYKTDIEALLVAKPQSWKLAHLGLWVDMVEVASSGAPAVQETTPAELMELEDQAHAARFREVRAKIAQDIAAMTAYNAGMEEAKRRTHVVNIMHERSQIQTGKQFLACTSPLLKFNSDILPFSFYALMLCILCFFVLCFFVFNILSF